MADQNRETDLIKTPEVATPRYFCKEPTEKKCIKGNQQKGMSKVAMIFEIKLTVEEAKDKIGVRKESHGQTGNSPPIPNFFIIYCPGDDCAGERMSNAVHKFTIT